MAEFVRKGRFITDPDGNKTDYQTINAAKRKSRELQRQGQTVRAQKEERKVPQAKKSAVRKFTSKAEERRHTANKLAKTADAHKWRMRADDH